MSDTESGWDRLVQTAVTSRPQGVASSKHGLPVDPLERAVIVGLLPTLPVGQQRFLLKYYRQCRRNYRLTRATARRAIAVQIVVEASRMTSEQDD